MSTIVQNAQKVDNTGANDNFTMGATPTSGNWLIAIGIAGGTCAVNTGWTSQATGGADNAGTITIAFKLCGGSESTTQTPFVINTGVANRFYGMIWEVSGLLDGTTFSNNVDATRITPATTISGSPGSQTVHGGATYTPASAGILVLALAGARCTAGNGIAPTFSNVGTWTVDQAIGTGSSSGNGRVGTGEHTVLGTGNPWASGAVTVTYDASGGDTYDLGSFGMIALKPAGGSTETGTVAMVFAGVSFGGTGSRVETATGTLAFAGISFSLSGQDIKEFGPANLAFNGISIRASGLKPPPAGTGIRQFSVFG